jgi:hypothetical protein
MSHPYRLTGVKSAAKFLHGSEKHSDSGDKLLSGVLN